MKLVNRAKSRPVGDLGHNNVVALYSLYATSLPFIILNRELPFSGGSRATASGSFRQYTDYIYLNITQIYLSLENLGKFPVLHPSHFGRRKHFLMVSFVEL